MKTNLRAGKVRMLFVAGEIPAELRRIVEFLNEQMSPAEVLALELRQFEGEGLKTLVPMVYGQTQEAQKNKGAGAPPPKQWDMASIYAELERKFGAEVVRVTRKIKQWIDQKGAQTPFGKGPTIGTAFADFPVKGRFIRTFSVATDGNVWVNFPRMPPFDSDGRRAELLRRINEIGVNMGNTSSSRAIPLALLADDARLTRFLTTMDWYVEEMSRTEG